MGQYIALGDYDLTGKVYDEMKPSGGYCDVKQDGATSLWTGCRKGDPKGSSRTLYVCFDDQDDASDFLAYCWPYNPGNPAFDGINGADISLYLRNEDWYYSVWGVVVKEVSLNKTPLDYSQYAYELLCYFYSPYTYATRPTGWLQSSITSLPVTKSISNRKGHLASAFESLSVTCTYNSAHVKNLVHSITNSDSVTASLTICDEALSDEVWELRGNENLLYETYIDEITSATKFNQDVTSGTPYSYVTGDPAIGWVQLDASDAPYYKLSGPNQVKKPIKLSACVTASGQSSIEISNDAISWTELYDESGFYGSSDPDAVNPLEFALSGTEYMTDVYVRFRCDTGNMWIGYIKFEVERWIEDGAVPQVAARQSATASIDATTGSEYVNIDGDFYVRRLFL